MWFWWSCDYVPRIPQNICAQSGVFSSLFRREEPFVAYPDVISLYSVIKDSLKERHVRSYVAYLRNYLHDPKRPVPLECTAAHLKSLPRGYLLFLFWFEIAILITYVHSNLKPVTLVRWLFPWKKNSKRSQWDQRTHTDTPSIKLSRKLNYKRRGERD